MNTNTLPSTASSSAAPRSFLAEPELNLRDPQLFPLDESENPETGVRPAKRASARAHLQPRHRNTAGPAGWGDFRQLNAALNAWSTRVGWTPNPKGPGARWIRKRTEDSVIPFPKPVELDCAA